MVIIYFVGIIRHGSIKSFLKTSSSAQIANIAKCANTEGGEKNVKNPVIRPPNRRGVLPRRCLRGREFGGGVCPHDVPGGFAMESLIGIAGRKRPAFFLCPLAVFAVVKDT